MGSDIFSSSTVPRFKSLELLATASVDGAALGRAMIRRAMSHPHYTPESVKFLSVEVEGTSNNMIEYGWNVWWEPPALWRDDVTWSNGATGVTIVRPDAVLTYVSFQRTLHITKRPQPDDRHQSVSTPAGLHLDTPDDRLRQYPLLHPRFPAADWQVASVEQHDYLGRSARRVRAARRADYVRPEYGEESGYWSGIDEYECIVDDALEIVVRLTGFDDGVSVGTVAASHLGVDTAIPPDTFTFAPPRGTRVEREA